MCHFPIHVIRAIRGFSSSAVRFVPSVSICVHLWFPLTLDTRHLALLAHRHSTLSDNNTKNMKENTVLEPQFPEIKSLLTEMQGGWAELKSLPAAVETLQEENANLLQQLDDLRLQRIAASAFRA